MKIDIDKIELPEWDIVKANPIRVQMGDKRELIFNIPSVKKWFDFEAMYVKYIATYFVLFSKVNFLEYKDFESDTLKKQMLIESQRVFQHKQAQKDFIKILNKYFKANFKIKKIMNYINLMQLSYLFLLIHKVIETVKKKMLENLVEINSQMSEIFSISLKKNSVKIEPRF